MQLTVPVNLRNLLTVPFQQILAPHHLPAFVSPLILVEAPSRLSFINEPKVDWVETSMFRYRGVYC